MLTAARRRSPTTLYTRLVLAGPCWSPSWWPIPARNRSRYATGSIALMPSLTSFAHLHARGGRDAWRGERRGGAWPPS